MIDTHCVAPSLFVVHVYHDAWNDTILGPYTHLEDAETRARAIREHHQGSHVVAMPVCMETAEYPAGRPIQARMPLPVDAEGNAEPLTLGAL